MVEIGNLKKFIQFTQKPGVLDMDLINLKLSDLADTDDRLADELSGHRVSVT